MTRNCLNVMRKLASLYKEATDYAAEWGSRYGYTDAELAPYRRLITPASSRNTLGLVHNRIHEARRQAQAAEAQRMVDASKPKQPEQQSTVEPNWTVDRGWNTSKPPKQPTAPAAPTAPLQ